MNTTRSIPRLRAGLAAAGIATLAGIGIAGASSAAEDVDVNVDIEPLDVGALAMTVAPEASVDLVENGSTGTYRQFTGTLPTVTVTDTREGTEVPAGAFWYVTASITDFTGDAGQPAIVSADSFGWNPDIITGDESNVAPGDAVEPGEGFTDFELFASAWSSEDAGPGEWTANADLTLQTPVTVEDGAYGATMTLSLFED